MHYLAKSNTYARINKMDIIMIVAKKDGHYSSSIHVYSFVNYTLFLHRAHINWRL